MTLQELQIEVDQWIKEVGLKYFDEKTNGLLLQEEVGELSRLLARKYGEQNFKSLVKKEEVNAHIGEELADILFVLVCLSNQMNYNLEKLVEENLHKKYTRDANRFKSKN